MRRGRRRDLYRRLCERARRGPRPRSHRRRRGARDGVMERAFGTHFTLGVEEELLLVDPETHALDPSSERILARFPDVDGSAHHDLYQALVEITTPICRTVDDASAALGALRQAVRTAGG